MFNISKRFLNYILFKESFISDCPNVQTRSRRQANFLIQQECTQQHFKTQYKHSQLFTIFGIVIFIMHIYSLQAFSFMVNCRRHAILFIN